MNRIARIALAAPLLLQICSAIAGNDVAKSKDHPLLTRYPGSFITDYSKNYNGTVFKVATPGGPETTQTVEGDTTSITYFYDSTDQQPSPLQVIRNYQNAIKAIGGTVVYERMPEGGDAGETTLRATASGKDIWVKLTPGYGAPTNYYQLVIAEVAAMSQVVSANAILDELKKNGFIALHINFDTGKAELKQDGLDTVQQIAAALKQDAILKLSVEGHTDNVGDAASNKKLSAARAKSVMNAIVAAGTDGSRLSAAGFGQEKPVADNRTEDGRAKNRRVELVKR
jgi:outer membrane protein OmpA-like peptidoglycan-associated protein